MAYCTSTNVQSEFKNLVLGSGNVLTSAEVDDFIAQADARIDAAIGNYYTVPVTANSSALLVLKTLSIRITANRIRRILAIKAGNADLDIFAEEDTAIDEYLKKLADGELLLPGATLVDSTGGVFSYNVDNDIEQTFDVTEQQW